MVETRRGTVVSPLKAPQPSKPNGKQSNTWAESNGTGKEGSSVWGLKGAAGEAVSLAGTLLLMMLCPGFAIYMWYALTKLDGSVVAVWHFAGKQGWSGVWNAWPTPSAEAWGYVVCFGVLEAFLQLALPGRRFLGPVTPKGNTPVYRANGLQAYFTTLALFFLSWRLGYFQPARVYDLLGEILSALNTFSIGFCIFLFVKGRILPSSTDSGTTGSLVYDFYWGMELYPRLGSAFDLKTWTNCRMGMMGWAVLTLCYVAKQYEAYGAPADSLFVSVALMQIYICKFFLWETGYWGSMDIMHDRAGYYICWGCLVWVPAIYTSPALYLVSHPLHLGWPAAAALLAAGALSIYVNYDSDRQRMVFRASNGRVPIWGRKPVIITAEYTTADGKPKKSLLLASGWWGLGRHFHYLPEILAAFFWSVPGGFVHPLPFFYVFFLVLLLTDRAFRDDARCSAKYGASWAKYCKLVPYKMVPYLF